MSRFLLIISALIIFNIACDGVKPNFLAETIKLPEPKKTGGMPLFKVMKNRHTDRNFTPNKDLTMEQLSQLLWSGYGPNRPDLKKTVPSSRSKYPFDVYAFTSTGVFKYKPNENELEVVSNRDFRGITGTQDFVADASLDIVLVADMDKEKDLPDPELQKAKVEFDSGHCIQNMLNYASSEGLKSVPRGMFVQGGILEILQLDAERYYIPITATIGY